MQLANRASVLGYCQVNCSNKQIDANYTSKEKYLM